MQGACTEHSGIARWLFNLVPCGVVVAALLSSAGKVAAQGVLWHVRDEVRTDRPDDPSEDSSQSWDDHDDDDTILGFLLEPILKPIGGAFVMAVTSPYWGPVVLANDDYQTRMTFAQHPYQTDRVAGYMLRSLQPEGRPWSIRSRCEYGTRFDNLQRIGGNLVVDSALRVGFDSSFDYYQEDLAPGIGDDLWIGDANVVFRFAQSERLMMRTGLGVNWLSDREGSDFGFNFTYGGDWFPRDPWIISSEIDWGRIGNAELFRFRATGGANIRNCEVYVGYDYADVGGENLGGFITGLRFWH